MIVSESLFRDFQKTVLTQGHDPKKNGNQFSDADRAQTYNVQQQFGRWA
jgi:hypothetical protein